MSTCLMAWEVRGCSVPPASSSGSTAGWRYKLEVTQRRGIRSNWRCQLLLLLPGHPTVVVVVIHRWLLLSVVQVVFQVRVKGPPVPSGRTTLKSMLVGVVGS